MCFNFLIFSKWFIQRESSISCKQWFICKIKIIYLYLTDSFPSFNWLKVWCIRNPWFKEVNYIHYTQAREKTKLLTTFFVMILINKIFNIIWNIFYNLIIKIVFLETAIHHTWVGAGISLPKFRWDPVHRCLMIILFV